MTEKIEETNREIRNAVRDHYAQAAVQSEGASCCSSCGEASSEAEKLYQLGDIADLPEEVVGLSLGCGDPVTLASLEAGQTVLDLGSGGGIDCFLAARRVGATGKVIGVDMTHEMLERARQNQKKLNAANVEFRLGEIEHLPVGNDEVDVIISNCVINLSVDKPQVFREAYRVLKPGGKLAVSDIVTDGPLPQTFKQNLSAWAGCLAGALDVADYVQAMESAGFIDITVEPVYMDMDTIQTAAEQLDLKDDLKDVNDIDLQKAVFSAKVKAKKPAL